MTQKALADIRVLELSRVLAGPWASQNLADLGADVIKVERPGTGDDTRQWGPPFLDTGGDGAGGGRASLDTAYFLSANRGKKSITVDLGDPRGQEIVRDLARRSDIVIENFRVGGAAKFGLDYDSLKALKPDLIYCSITGFGQDGPYKDRGGYDFMIQAMGGLMSLTGERDDRPGGGPQKVGVAISDLFAGMYATTAIMTALRHRDRTGEGQYIDIALLDCTAAILSMMAASRFMSGRSPGRIGNAHPNVAPYGLFATADDPIVIAVGNDGQFARYCEALGRPELAEDARFRTNKDRLENLDILDGICMPILAERSSADWLSALAKAIVPSGPVNSVGAVFDDPQVRHRGMKIELPHDSGRVVAVAGSPMRLSATPVSYGRAAPMLGRQTDAVLEDLLDMDAETRAALRRDGVI